jgi:acyl-coenzyme A thioesterase PaaI-like protein
LIHAHKKVDMQAEGWNIITDEGFVGLIGPFWQKTTGAGLLFCFPTDSRHHNLRGVLQGGALMTFADRVLGMTTRMLTQATRTATMQLDVQFIDAVQIGETVDARPELLRATRNTAFLRSTLTVDGRVVGNAQGQWKLLHPREPKVG